LLCQFSPTSGKKRNALLRASHGALIASSKARSPHMCTASMTRSTHWKPIAHGSQKYQQATSHVLTAVSHAARRSGARRRRWRAISAAA
tara:strand:+ start:1062 stop:1328 length:267 start_codon:yes stop_codon:yes gene_type:complete